MRPQREPQHYQGLRYDRKTRFVSYWHQIQQVIERSPENVLEVGIGNGFVHRYLRNAGVDVHTLDFDERLGPDTVGSVLELPFDDGAFDLVCCCETLEHIPWDDFAPALRQLRRVARRWALISLPDVTPYVRAHLEVSRQEKFRKMYELPNRNPLPHVFDGEHYWEIGKQGYPLSKITSVVEGEGLVIDENFRVFELPYHRFISCRV